MLYLVNDHKHIPTEDVEKVYVFGVHEYIKDAIEKKRIISLLDEETAYIYSKKLNIAQLPYLDFNTLNSINKHFGRFLISFYLKHACKGDLAIALEHEVVEGNDYFGVYKGELETTAKPVNILVKLDARHIQALFENPWGGIANPNKVNDLLKHIRDAVHDDIRLQAWQQEQREKTARAHIENPKGPRRA